MGWSQGGYISAFLTTRHSDRFKAISVGAGISDWMTYYVNTDIHPFTRQYLKATPWDDPKIYADTSPMTYIKQAKTPTLIQHGEDDARVPIPNAFQLYQGLRDQNVPVQLSIFKGFGHGLTKPKANRAAMQQNLDWFTRYIWNQPAGDSSKLKVTAQSQTMNTFRLRDSVALIASCCHCSTRRSAQTARPSVVAIRGGTVLTVTRGTIQNGTVVLRDGKIAAVGGSGHRHPVRRRHRRCQGPLRDAGHHRRALAHRRRFDQRGRHDGELDDRHRGRARSHRRQHLSRPRRRADGGQRAARQRQPDRRQEPGDQAALGQERARAGVRGRAAGDQVRARREPERHAAVRPDRTAPLSGDAAGRGVRDSRRVQPRQGVPA